MASAPSDVKVTSSVIIAMEAWQKDRLSHYFTKPLQDCFIHFDQHENLAILTGKADYVSNYHFTILKELNKLRTKLLALTPSMHSVLSKEQGKQYLHHLNSSKLQRARVFLQDEALLVTDNDVSTLNYAKDFLRSILKYKEILKIDVKIPVEKLHLLQSTLEQRFLVTVIYSNNGTVVCVKGVKDDVVESCKEIKQMKKSHEAHLKNNPISQGLSEEHGSFKKARQENENKLQNKLEVKEAEIKHKGDNEVHEKAPLAIKFPNGCLPNDTQCLQNVMTAAYASPGERGTYEFLRYAADNNEQFPSYWKLNSSEDCKRSLWSLVNGKLVFNKSEEHKILVDVDTKTKDAIKILVTTSFDPAYKELNIIDVKRVENLKLYQQYSMKRRSLLKRICSENNTSLDIEKLKGSRGSVGTTKLLEECMKEELCFDINEHYLFHDTKVPAIVCSNGIDPHDCSDEAKFGKGICTAEIFTPPESGSGTEKNYPGKIQTMILARVLLGNVFIYDIEQENNKVKLTRPPCVACQEANCDCSSKVLYDSVMVDLNKTIYRNGVRTCCNREFVVYDRNQFYPEYIIYYTGQPR